MRAIKLIAIALLAWPAAEIVAFACIAVAVGFMNAIFLVLLLSLAGLFTLRHFSGGVTRFHAAGNAGSAAAMLGRPALASGLGGILLLIPGFVTSVLGVLILLPISRRWLLAGCRRAMAARRPTSPDVVDLGPNEWRPLPGPKLPPASGPLRN